MIRKGFHYAVDCDAPGCDVSYVVGTTRHNFDARRQAKRKVIKEGWTMGESGTAECKECGEKRSEKNTIRMAKAMKESEEKELVTK